MGKTSVELRLQSGLEIPVLRSRLNVTAWHETENLAKNVRSRGMNQMQRRETFEFRCWLKCLILKLRIRHQFWTVSLALYEPFCDSACAPVLL